MSCFECEAALFANRFRRLVELGWTVTIDPIFAMGSESAAKHHGTLADKYRVTMKFVAGSVEITKTNHSFKEAFEQCASEVARLGASVG